MIKRWWWYKGGKRVRRCEVKYLERVNTRSLNTIVLKSQPISKKRTDRFGYERERERT